MRGRPCLENTTMAHPRTTPAVYKPLIDSALQKFARHAGKSPAELAKKLDALDVRDLGPWGYLMQALESARPLLLSAHARERLRGDWFLSFLTNDNANNNPPTGLAGDCSDGDEYDDSFENLISLEYYPEEAREGLAQEHFVGGTDADVIFLWKGELTKVCHAHPEGFWILGDDPIDFVERAAKKLD